MLVLQSFVHGVAGILVLLPPLLRSQPDTHDCIRRLIWIYLLSLSLSLKHFAKLRQEVFEKSGFQKRCTAYNILHTPHTLSLPGWYLRSVSTQPISRQIFIKHLGGLSLCRMLGGLHKMEDREAPGEHVPSYWGGICVREWLPEQIILEELKCSMSLHASKVFAQTVEQIWYLNLFYVLWFVFSLQDW